MHSAQERWWSKALASVCLPLTVGAVGQMEVAPSAGVDRQASQWCLSSCLSLQHLRREALAWVVDPTRVRDLEAQLPVRCSSCNRGGDLGCESRGVKPKVLQSHETYLFCCCLSCTAPLAVMAPGVAQIFLDVCDHCSLTSLCSLWTTMLNAAQKSCIARCSAPSLFHKGSTNGLSHAPVLISSMGYI